MKFLEGDLSYELPRYLFVEYVDLKKIGRRNLWNGLFHVSLLYFAHYDLMIAIKATSKLIKCCTMSLHNLWIARCDFICMQTEKEVSVDELNELKLEVEDLLLVEDFRKFLEEKDI